MACLLISSVQLLRYRNKETRLHAYESEWQGMPCMYNIIKMLSHNHCFHGKAISIKYSECVSVALVIQRAKWVFPVLYYIFDCGMSHSALFFSHYLINGVMFGINLLNRKWAFWIFSPTFIWNISHSQEFSIILS